MSVCRFVLFYSHGSNCKTVYVCCALTRIIHDATMLHVTELTMMQNGTTAMVGMDNNNPSENNINGSAMINWVGTLPGADKSVGKHSQI